MSNLAPAHRAKQRPQIPPFAMMPLELLARPDLLPAEKLLMAVIMSLTKGPFGRCFAHNEKLAEMTGMSVIQTRRNLQSLEERALISRVMDGTKRVEIKVKWPRVRVHHDDTGPSITMMQGVHHDDAPDKSSDKTREKEFAGGCAPPQEKQSKPIPPGGYPHPPRPAPQQNLNAPTPVVPDDNPALSDAMARGGLRAWIAGGAL